MVGVDSSGRQSIVGADRVKGREWRSGRGWRAGVVLDDRGERWRVVMVCVARW